MAARRVAVTGTGVISALGASLAAFHRSLAAGRSGIRRLPPELADSGVQVGAAVDWKANEREAANLDRVSQLALAATAEAVAASALPISAANRDASA